MANNKIIDLNALQEFLAKCDIRYQTTLVSGTNIKTINNTTLLGSGNYAFDSELSDSSTNAVQNKVLKGYLDDISTRLATLEESIIDDETLAYTYLQQSAIPTIVSSYPIIESAGMDNTDIKGHSFVYNQQYKITQDNTNTQDGLSCAMSIANNTFTFNGTTTAGSYYEGTYRFPVPQAMVSGHKYLVFSKAISGYSTGQIRFRFTALGTQDIDQTTPYILTATSNSKRVDYYYNNGLTFTNYVVKLYCFDLTQSGIDSATTADEAIALLQQNGINPYEYNDYSAGKINDSKPTAIVSHWFNIWDEEWELGAINLSSGALIYGTSIRSKNYIRAIGGSTIYLCSTNSVAFGLYVVEYDENNNYVYGSSDNRKNTILTLKPNTKFIKFYCSNAYGTTYNHDICINLSNASLNGTYRPYKAPIAYQLNVPILRSVGSVQDDVKKVNVDMVDLGALSDWTYSNNAKGWISTEISSLIKLPVNAQTKANAICSNYNNVSLEYLYAEETRSGNIAVATSGNLLVNNGSTTTQPTGILNFELATPIDQPAITLPENIEFEKGGSLEVIYDSTNKTPSDFDFEVAVYKPIQ